MFVNDGLRISYTMQSGALIKISFLDLTFEGNSQVVLETIFPWRVTFLSGRLWRAGV